LQGTNIVAAVAHRNYQRAIFDADARMPLDALADNIASLKLVHWRRCRAPLAKILCPGQFSLSLPDRRFSRSSRKSRFMPWHDCCSFHRA